MQIKMEIYIFGIPPLNLIMIVLLIWTVRVAIRNIELDTDIDRLNCKASTQQAEHSRQLEEIEDALYNSRYLRGHLDDELKERDASHARAMLAHGIQHQQSEVQTATLRLQLFHKTNELNWARNEIEVLKIQIADCPRQQTPRPHHRRH